MSAGGPGSEGPYGAGGLQVQWLEAIAQCALGPALEPRPCLRARCLRSHQLPKSSSRHFGAITRGPIWAGRDQGLVQKATSAVPRNPVGIPRQVNGYSYS